jgi:uncharacterized protein
VSTGLIALLDDVIALAKVASATLDDAAGQAAKVGSKAVSKAAGIVIDDAAVTPRYVVGLAPERELPIIGKIAVGSVKNKLLFLLPGALVLSAFAPFLITPLLMIGGAYLCYEGWHKVADLIGLHHDKPEDASDKGVRDPQEVEQQRVQSAIRTDFILSAEIMAITLSTVISSPVWLQAVVMAVVGLAMTLMVYGAVAIIVKVDDFGLYLADQPSATVRTIGRTIVLGMPVFLQLLSFVGMIAMLWVGGGILVHALHELGVHAPEEWLTHTGDAITPVTGEIGGWAIKTTISAAIGLVVGAIVELLSTKVFTRGFLAIKTMLGARH